MVKKSETVMNSRTLLIAILGLLLIPAVTAGHSGPRVTIPTPSSYDAGVAVALLKHLETKVIVYRSLGDFEADGRLANVTVDGFEHELFSVMTQLEPILETMPTSKTKTELANALASYRDGLYWWRKVDRPRVVDISRLSFATTQSAPDAVLMSTASYTVAIHWRQAATYLRRAETSIGSH